MHVEALIYGLAARGDGALFDQTENAMHGKLTAVRKNQANRESHAWQIDRGVSVRVKGRWAEGAQSERQTHIEC